MLRSSSTCTIAAVLQIDICQIYVYIYRHQIFTPSTCIYIYISSWHMSTNIHIKLCTYVYIYIVNWRMSIYPYICVESCTPNIRVYIYISNWHVSIYMYISNCEHVYIYIYIYQIVYICIYIYISHWYLSMHAYICIKLCTPNICVYIYISNWRGSIWNTATMSSLCHTIYIKLCTPNKSLYIYAHRASSKATRLVLTK